MRTRGIRAFLLPGETAVRTYPWTLVSGFTAAGSTFVLLLVCSRVLGVFEAGILSLAIALSQQLGTICMWGMRGYQVSDAAEQYSFADYTASRVVTTLIMFLAAAVWIPTLGGGLEKAVCAALLVLAKALEGWSQIFEGRYQQRGRLDAASRGMTMKFVVSLMAFAVVCLATKNLVASLVLYCAVFAGMIVWLDGALLPEFGGLHFRAPVRKIVRLLVACSPLLAMNFLQMWTNNIQKFSIDRHLDEAELARYSILFMCPFVFTIVGSAMLEPVVARSARLLLDGKRRELALTVLGRVATLVALFVPGLVVCWYLGEPILEVVFRIPFDGLRDELCILLASGLLLSLSLVFQMIFEISRKQAWCAITFGISTVFALIVTPGMVERGGLHGAAMSYALSMAVLDVASLPAALPPLFRKRNPEVNPSSGGPGKSAR